MPLLLRLLLVAALATAGGCLPGSGAADPFRDSAPLPRDTTARVGRLSNGLTFYILPNAEPPDRAELRLAVDVGSVVEDADQQGLAHFLEHMAFNGTESFPPGELVDYLERTGMRFGPHVNAYTGFDETVYRLTLPTDTAGVLETGLEVMRDWAGGMLLDPAEIDRERGVVVEEWRLGRGAGARVRDRHLPVLFRRSRYARRLPIGDPGIVRTFRPETLRRFYRDWYRPDLMAVVVVGDVDPDSVERVIRARFGTLPAVPQEARRHRRRYDLPVPAETRVAVAADPELSRATVTLARVAEARRQRTVGDYRRRIVESLVTGMLSDRLSERVQQPDAPFLGVSSYTGSLLRSADAQMLTAEADAAGVERALAALAEESRRAALHGFTRAELAREKSEVARAWDRIYVERERATSTQFAGQYVGHFLYGGPLLSTEAEHALHRALLPRISRSEVNAAAREMLGPPARTVLVSAPAPERGALPPEARLAAVLDSVAAASPPPWRETVSDAPLLAEEPAPGRVVSERSWAGTGVTEWTLANGARVLLKPTDFRPDEVMLLGRSPGGLSLVPDGRLLAARTATAAAQVGGVGDLSVVDLQKRLAGRTASVGTDLGETHETVSGYASPGDLETMLRLVHLYFTAPRRDPEAWESYRERARASLELRGASPEAAFRDTLQHLLTGGHPRARPLEADDFGRADLDASLAVYRERFADGDDFTFYLVGAFDPDSVRPLVETYLGGLPAAPGSERPVDRGIAPAQGVERRTVRRGLEPQARTQLVFTGPVEMDRAVLGRLAALSEVLQRRLRDRLREELGGTYGVGVGAGVEAEPEPRYRLSLAFGAAPDRVEELTAVVWEEIERLREEGPNEEDLEKARETRRRERETDLRDNDWWLRQLATYEERGWPLDSIVEPPESAAPLSVEALRDAARRFLVPGRYLQVTLLPEAGAPPADTVAAGTDDGP